MDVPRLWPQQHSGSYGHCHDTKGPEPHAHQPWVLMREGGGSRKRLEQVIGVSGVCVYPCSGWAATALPRRAARAASGMGLMTC